MRRALAPLLFDEEDHEAAETQRSSIVAPAQRSLSAQQKAISEQTVDGFPVHSLRRPPCRTGRSNFFESARSCTQYTTPENRIKSPEVCSLHQPQAKELRWYRKNGVESATEEPGAIWAAITNIENASETTMTTPVPLLTSSGSFPWPFPWPVHPPACPGNGSVA